MLAFVAAYNDRDIDSAVALCAADVNAFPDASVFPESGALVGRDEFRGFLEEIWSAWASGGITNVEALDLEDGRVLVQGDWGGTGISSGVEAYMNLSSIYTFRNGQISRAEYFFDHGRALEAARLSE